MLCTDGLVDGLFDAQILDILHTSRPFGPESNPAQRLVHTAVTQAGRDNTTALVIEAALDDRAGFSETVPVYRPGTFKRFREF